jgi:hypothetical protein
MAFMGNQTKASKSGAVTRNSRPREPATAQPEGPLHPAWRGLIKLCAEMRYGEIDRLTIQDGLPVIAEVTKKKVKFT